MARWDPVAWLQGVLEKELVVPEYRETPEAVPRVLRARDVGLADVRILPPTPIEKASDAQLRAVISFRLIFPKVEEGKITGYEVSEQPFEGIHLRESPNYPGRYYLRFPSLRQIAYYRIERRHNRHGEPYEVPTPVYVWRQGYGLTPSQREFLIAAYKHLRDVNGWERVDVEEVPQPVAATGRA